MKTSTKKGGVRYGVYAKLVWDAPWSREQRFLVRIRNIPPASPLSFRLNEGGYRVVGQEAAHTYPVSVHEKYMWLIINPRRACARVTVVNPRRACARGLR